MRWHIPLVVAATLALGACGKNVVKPAGAEKVVVDVVNGRTQFKPNDVNCPSGVEAEVGDGFDCAFTGPDADYVAHMRIRNVEGTRVEFAVETEPKRG